MLARKYNPKKHVKAKRHHGRNGFKGARPGETLELVPENFLRICGLNGLMACEVPGLIERSKVQMYRALRNPWQHKPTFARIDEVLPKRMIPADMGD